MIHGQIPRIKLPNNFDSLSNKDLLKMIRDREKSPDSVKSRVNVMERLYKETSDRLTGFNEELESEFRRVIKLYNLPLDKQAISDAGIVVERSDLHTEDNASSFSSMNHTATITMHGRAVSRTIGMNDARVSSDCISAPLKGILIKEGLLCLVLDDIKRMGDDAIKTLQELLDEPDKPNFNCSEIGFHAETNKINRVMILGQEYRG